MSDGHKYFYEGLSNGSSGLGATPKPTPGYWPSSNSSGLTQQNNHPAGTGRDGEAAGLPPVNMDIFASNMWNVMEHAGELLLKKHNDYGPTNISRSPGGPLNGLRVRMWDKMARINNLLDSGVTPENESLRDSFEDLLNYSAIAMMVLDGDWPNE